MQTGNFCEPRQRFQYDNELGATSVKKMDVNSEVHAHYNKGLSLALSVEISNSILLENIKVERVMKLYFLIAYR